MQDLAPIDLPERDHPLQLVWPTDLPAAPIEFREASEWKSFVAGLGIDPRIPLVVQAKFARAQTLYVLGWVDLGLIKVGELAALVALELALKDRYGGRVARKDRGLAGLLRYMVEGDGLTDADLPMIVRCGGTAVGQLVGDVRPTLAERRNGLAHGDPFDGLPTGGLLELVRDLIDYAYRDYLAEANGLGISA